MQSNLLIRISETNRKPGSSSIAGVADENPDSVIDNSDAASPANASLPTMTPDVRKWRARTMAGAGAMLALLLTAVLLILKSKPVAVNEFAAPRTQAAMALEAPAPMLARAGLPQRSVAAYNLAASAPPPPIAQGPMIARTVSLSIFVKDFAASRGALDRILAQVHGYPASLTVNTPEGGGRSLEASLRIPAADLPSAMGRLRSLGHVLSETQSGEEVTQQHADLVARLQNSREEETRLRAILEQRTGKIEDVLQVEEAIARVRGEIESMEAEQKSLEHRIDFATVDLQFTEEYKESLNPSAESASARLYNALIAGLRNASATVLGIVLFLEEFGPAILVWLAILGVPAFMVWRRRRRMRAAV